MIKKQIIIGLTGDLLFDRDDPATAFEKVKSALDSVDILSGNFEMPCTDDPHMAPSGGTLSLPGASNLKAFGAAGFDVLSLANNHIIDGGHDAMLYDREQLNLQGIATSGAGKNLAEAREPAIVEAGGVKVAFLSYASVFPMGYEANTTKPGLAPMRGYNLYREAFDNYQGPGLAPRVESIPDQTDLDNLREDIANAHKRADIVVASFHWGDFMKPFYLTDFETKIAHYCIDQGADMVVGHHHHTLRGMEWYKGKPIMYGLGHFIFDAHTDKLVPPDLMKVLGNKTDDPNFYGFQVHEDWPLLALHPDARMTAMAWATVSEGKIDGIGFLPCRLHPDGSVAPVDPDSAEGKEVVEYVEKGCSTQGLNACIETEGAIELAGHRTVRVVPGDNS
jgi:poly-gamma-glutamate synthesis protein (capsule biosynthesis protein)